MTFSVVDGVIELTDIEVKGDDWDVRLLERPDRIRFEAERGDAKVEVSIEPHDGGLRVETRIETGD